MIYVFHPAAEKDFQDAVEYYDESEAGLAMNSISRCLRPSSESLTILTLGRDIRIAPVGACVTASHTP
jgi:hypothetical protein